MMCSPDRDHLHRERLPIRAARRLTERDCPELIRRRLPEPQARLWTRANSLRGLRYLFQNASTAFIRRRFSVVT